MSTALYVCSLSNAQAYIMSVSGDAILDPPLVGSNALLLSDSGRDTSPPVHVDAKLSSPLIFILIVLVVVVT